MKVDEKKQERQIEAELDQIEDKLVKECVVNFLVMSNLLEYMIKVPLFCRKCIKVVREAKGRYGLILQETLEAGRVELSDNLNNLITTHFSLRSL